MPEADVEVPVLIVGGGPVGLTARALLDRWGVPTLLVEKHRELSPFPRFRLVNVRSMEIFRQLGIASRITAGVFAPEYGRVRFRDTLYDADFATAAMVGVQAPTNPGLPSCRSSGASAEAGACSGCTASRAASSAGAAAAADIDCGQLGDLMHPDSMSRSACVPRDGNAGRTVGVADAHSGTTLPGVGDKVSPGATRRLTGRFPRIPGDGAHTSDPGGRRAVSRR